MSALADLLSARRDALLARLAASPGGVPAGLREALGEFVDEVDHALTGEHRGVLDDGLRQLELFQQAPGFVAFLRGPTHVFELTNAAYDQVVAHRDVVGKPVRDALPELVGQGFYELLDQVYATGTPFVGRAVRIELQGEPGEPLVEAFLDFIYQPIRGGDGRIMGILVQGHDVTETRRQEAQREAAEQALRASEERYRTLFESIDDGFCVMQMLVDAQGKTVDYRFLQTNAAFEGQTGLRDAVGKTARELVPDLDASWFEIYGEVAASGATRRFENHAPAMDGRWFDVYASRVGPPDHRLVALVFKDITARKKAEQQREQVLVQLAKSNESLDQFAYIASHDLKAPLRGIANLSEWIEDDLGDAVTDDARKKLGLLRGRVHHLEKLIEGILSYSTAGRRKAKPEPVDVGALVADAVELLAPAPDVALSVGPLPTVVAERVPLQQVFMNLIGNALKHCQRTDGAIQVAALDEDDTWHFTVADNGPGIPPEHHARIWGIFQKLGGNVEGTGIGLSVVKRIVESRGGRVWVESQPGQGATFHVAWPKQPVESA